MQSHKKIFTRPEILHPPNPRSATPLYSFYSLYSLCSLYSPPPGVATHDAVRQAIGAVFFRRSRLFLREAAFFSGGEGCEWRAQRATVGSEWGYNGENSFSALYPFAGSRKGEALTSPPPDFLFSSIHQKLHPTKPTQSKNSKFLLVGHLWHETNKKSRYGEGCEG